MAVVFAFYRRPVLERRNIMWFFSRLGSRRRSAASRSRLASPSKRFSQRPLLEVLEDRVVPSGSYVFTTIDDPNGVTGTTAYGINTRGDVVGSFSDVNFGSHGFLLRGGQYITLKDPPNSFPGLTYATDINDRGEIVGHFAYHGGDAGFLLSRDGHYTTLIDPNAVGFTFANGINDRGQIVGLYDLANFTQHGFLLSDGQYTTIDYPNSQDTVPGGINNRGQIAGEYLDANNNQHGFLRSRDGQYTTLDDPNGVYGTWATGINDRGQITGWYSDANLNIHGFLLSDGHYTTLDDPNGVNTTFAFGINDLGEIVGQYSDATGTHGFLATPDAGSNFAPLASSLLNTRQSPLPASPLLGLATMPAPRPIPTEVFPTARTTAALPAAAADAVFVASHAATHDDTALLFAPLFPNSLEAI
jgi:probable HAF family extracellular repeat protein